jgi:hypothetical protein
MTILFRGLMTAVSEKLMDAKLLPAMLIALWALFFFSWIVIS